MSKLIDGNDYGGWYTLKDKITPSLSATLFLPLAYSLAEPEPNLHSFSIKCDAIQGKENIVLVMEAHRKRGHIVCE